MQLTWFEEVGWVGGGGAGGNSTAYNRKHPRSVAK